MNLYSVTHQRGVACIRDGHRSVTVSCIDDKKLDNAQLIFACSNMGTVVSGRFVVGDDYTSLYFERTPRRFRWWWPFADRLPEIFISWVVIEYPSHSHIIPYSFNTGE